MNIPKVEDVLGEMVTKQVLKKAMGDGYEFELVYEAIINSDSYKEMYSTSNDEVSGELSTESQYIPTSSGQSLEQIPLRYRQTPLVSGEIYLDNVSDESSNNLDLTNSDYKSLSQVKKSDYSQLISDASNKTYDVNTIYKTVDKYSEMYEVDKNLILAIIKQESNFNPNATSIAGAKGLMQLMDFNSEAYGLTNPYDIEQNIEAGVKHIKSYINMYDGNMEMALMAYNGGPGTMERRGVNSVSDLYKMPQETQNYVPSVLAYYQEYKDS